MTSLGFFIERLIPRHPNGRIEWRRFPPPPPRAHEVVIQQITRLSPYYDCLNRYPPFRDALRLLLVDWTHANVERFLLSWPLGRYGYADLFWTHLMWLNGWNADALLMPGFRSCGDGECCTRTVPSRGLSLDDQRRGARRLFRKQVLGLFWPQLARAEAADDNREFLDEDDLENYSNTLKQDVRRWRRALGIPVTTRSQAG